MACPPAYNPTDSLHGTSLDADPTTHRWPTAYLPSYSTVTPSYWLEEAALEVLRTSHDFDDIKLVVKFTPGLDSTTAATLLSSRRKGWLDAFLHVLCRDEAVDKPPCDPPLSTAEAIVAIIRRRSLSPVLGWNGDWILPALLSSSDIPTVAEKLDTQIHSTFCMFPFEDWVAWCHGYRNDAISNFLDTVFDFRNKLARHVQQHAAVADGLLLLQKALPSQQPLPSWIVSTAISFDTSSDPSEALRFFFDSIYQLLDKQPSGILPIVRKLSILDTRFKLKVVSETDANWPKPFSTDFLFWESIQRDSPEDLAKSNTESVSSLYSVVSPRDLLYDSKLMKDIASLWSDLSDDILACLIANGKLTGYFMNFAEYLLLLRNVHSAGAVGLALSKWGFQPRKPSRVWDIINPDNSFAGCRKLMAEEACLPLIFPYLVELRRSGNASDKLVEAFQFVGFFGRRKKAEARPNAIVEEKTDREGTIVNRNPPYHIVLLSSSWPPNPRKQKAVLDLDGENPQQSGLVTKGIKADNNTTARSDSYSIRQALGDAKSTRNNCSEIQQLHPQSSLGIRDKQDLFSKPLSADEFLIAFREQYADEIWALKAKTNYQIFKEAHLQIIIMLQGIVHASIIALEILSGLERTQMILLSCAIENTGRCILAPDNCLNSRAWTEEQKAHFGCKFTNSVPGPWYRGDVLDKWEELVKVFIDKMHLRMSEKTPMIRAVSSFETKIEGEWIGTEQELKETLRHRGLK